MMFSNAQSGRSRSALISVALKVSKKLQRFVSPILGLHLIGMKMPKSYERDSVWHMSRFSGLCCYIVKIQGLYCKLRKEFLIHYLLCW